MLLREAKQILKNKGYIIKEDREDSRPFGSIYMNDFVGEAKPEFFYVIVNETGRFLKTKMDEAGGDDVGFTKNINEADLMSSFRMAGKIARFVEEYNPDMKLTIKKVNLSV